MARYPRRRIVKARRPRRKAVRKYRPRYYKKRMMKKSKSQLSAIRVQSNGIGKCYSQYNSLVPRWKGKLEKVYLPASKNIYQVVTPAQGGATAGTQLTFQVPIGNVSDLRAALTSVGIGPTGNGNLVNTSRSYFREARCEIAMTNSSTVPIEVSLYLYKCVKDADIDINTAWDNSFKDEQNTGVPTFTRNSIGANPLDALEINSWYKCHKIIHMDLNPGQTAVHRYNNNIYSLLNNAELESANTTATMLKRFSSYVLIVAKGFPASLQSGLSPFVTTPQFNLDLVYTKRYDFKYIQDNNTNFTYGSGAMSTGQTIVFNQSGTAPANISINANGI